MKSTFRAIQYTVLALTILFSSCESKKKSSENLVPEYNSLVTAFTNGIISSESAVKVNFSHTFPDSVELNSTLDDGIFTISPKVRGEVYYTGQQSIEFRPDDRFESGNTYEVDLKLNKLFPASESAKTFSFKFQVIKQNIDVELLGFRPYDDYKPESNFLSGILRTADIADPDKVKLILTAKQNNKGLEIKWDHQDDGLVHNFTIENIARGDEESKVILYYDGESILAEQKGDIEYVIPAQGDFKVLDHKIIQYPEQHVILNFSDPIKKDQHLDGLIRLSNDTDLRYIIEGSSVKVYPNVRQNGSLILFVEPGVKNTAGKGMITGERLAITFEEIKPKIELLGQGVIIPSANDVLLPFKAVNLKAVDVKVIRIYEDNIAQFLQVNALSGDRELKRAGRLVAKKTIELVSDKPINYGQWNTFSLNLNELVKTEPGAIYRIELNFRQSQSVFPCPGDDVTDLTEEEEDYDNLNEEEMSYWDTYESYYSDWDSYYYDGYDWDDRENPCKPAYYGTRRAVSRNVLASNLGVIAKFGSAKKLNVTVTDLLKAEPIGNARVKIYNFQQQLLGEGSTDGQGLLELDVESKPFLVVAEYGGQKGYLRLVDGAALSYSMFDVSGTVVKKGLKGFLYGDRGVWRPGDSLFINLILNDQANPLPEGYPVNFTLKNPQGKVVQQKTAIDDGSGFFSFYTRTNSDAPTGSYTIQAKAGGVVFTKILQIETIKPNRLKIELSFDGDTIYPSRGPVSANLFGKWLTGATASNLRAEVEVLLSPASTTFKGYDGYTFTNPANKLPGYASSFWSGTVDATGNASFSESIDLSGRAPGMLNAIFTTRLFEKSGDFSIDQKTVKCSPYKTYVGIKTPPGDKRNMLLTDTLHTVKVVTLTADGVPETKLGLDVKVFKLSWRWWWDASNENLASYMGSGYRTPVYETTISTKNGQGSFNFRIDYPEWGRYMIIVTDKGGHSAAKIVYIDWPGWAGRAKKGDPDAASVLSFSSDKTTYQVGETAEISIPSSNKGNVLISIENGSRVLKQEWIRADGSETKYSLKLTPEMTPNVYVYASLLQEHKNTENDLPIRMFGVIPLSVEDPDTRLYPVLKMPDELAPETTVKLEVSEKYGKEMTYTIAIVDEGLLDLTRFNTPDPWSTFYAREALGVKTWDMFEYVLGAYGGRIDGIYSIGGGDDEAGDGAKDANRFPPMVRFIGPFTLSGKSKQHTIEIPNYIGSVRTMVVAGNKAAYGNTEKTTPVKKPLMLLATLPRILGPGEEVSFPVNVFVMDEGIRNVELSIQTNELFEALENRKTIEFSGTGDEIVEFRLKTPQRTGIARVTVQAKSGKHTAEYEIELNVRSSNPPVTKYLAEAVEVGKTFDREIEYCGMIGTNDLLLEVSNIPPVDFGRRLKYLIQYPHGCIEQTTSAAFPQLFLGDVIELDEKMKRRTEDNVKAAIRRLSGFQIASGGFSYWPGSIYESDWGSSYAGHFLLEARDKGYDVPSSIINNWQRYQKNAARKWNISGSKYQYEISQQQMLQAYRLFTLALSGKAEIGSMNRLRERTDLVPEAKWRLAAAYALAGQKETARQLIIEVPTDVGDYYDSKYTFGSRTRDQAMILEAMILIGMKENGMRLLEQIAAQLSAERYMSTQTTAYSLIAIAKYTGGRTSSERINFQYAFNGESRKKAETGMPISQLVFEPGEDKKGRVEVINNSEGILFVRVINTGLPAPGAEEAVESNLKMEVSYFDMGGSRITPQDITQGTDFKVQYRIYNPGTMGYLDNLALTSIYPSGWEIHNERLFSTSNSNQQFTYQDIRDDRVMTYFSMSGNSSKTFTIRLNAAYQGRFYLPSVKVEEMYKNDVQVLIPGQWINVSRQ